MRYFRAEHDDDKPWLFPQLLRIVREWIATSVHLADGAFPQMLRIGRYESDALDKIYRAVAASDDGDLRVEAVLQPGDATGSTAYVDFDTTKPVCATDRAKCHVSHVVGDSGWEHKMAQVLESMPEVDRYVKNQGLGFTIPYTIDGQQRSYLPDFVAVLDGGLHLIVEVSGENRRDKEAKVSTARQLWVPAVNRHSGLGRWGFVEITDPWDAEGVIRGTLAVAQGG
jgi:type III restriction enzyme